MGVNRCNYGYMVRSDSIHITPELLNSIAKMDEFKGRWGALGTLASDRLLALRRIATLESIGSSMRMAGSTLSDQEVLHVLSQVDVKSFDSRDEQEVAGYAELMDLVYASWRDIPLSENHIKLLHQILMRYSKKDIRHRGQYKTDINPVSFLDEHGAQGISFQTATPFETPRLMTELVLWVQTEREAGRLHPLLIIGLFTAAFLEIHPFQEGNGRLSRVLTTLLLLQAGYTYVPYCSLDSILEHRQEAYDAALRQTIGTFRSEVPHWQPWLLFFLGSLTEQTCRLEKKIEEERCLVSSLPELSLKLVEFTRDHGRMTMAAAMKLTGISRNTLKQHVRKLVRQGYLQQHGAGRGVWYDI